MFSSSTWLHIHFSSSIEQVSTIYEQENENTQNLGQENSWINGFEEMEKKELSSPCYSLEFKLEFAHEFDCRKQEEDGNLIFPFLVTILLKKIRREWEKWEMKWSVREYEGV